MSIFRSLSAVIVIALLGCGESASPTAPPSNDAGMDVAMDSILQPDTQADVPDLTDLGSDMDVDVPQIEPTPRQDGVSPQGSQQVEGEIDLGEVRAGALGTGNGAFGGVEASCKVGDFVLANGFARYCVDSERTSGHLFFDGGRLIDAVPANATAGDRLHVASVFAALQTGSARTVEVIQDGTAGPLAVVRVEGVLEPVMYFAGAVGPALFVRKPLDVVTEYRLRDDSAALEMVTWYQGRDAVSVVSPGPGDLIFWGDTLEYVFPGHGRSAPAQVTSVLGLAHDVAYGWFADAQTTAVDLPGFDLPAVPLTAENAVIAPGETVVNRRWFVVGAGGAEVMARFTGRFPEHPAASEQSFLSSVVVVRAGERVAGATVELRAPEGQAGSAEPGYPSYSDANGVATVFAPAGDYTVHVSGPQGTAAQADATVSEGQEVLVELAPLGTLTLQVQHALGEQQVGSPARVRLTHQETQQTRLWLVKRGEHVGALVPGTWNYEISRGSEYSYHAGQVEIEAGSSTQLDVLIEHVVPTPGFISGEFHQHSSASLDSEVSVEDRVLGNLVEGVDFAVSSDHDIATDFAPVIESLGVRDLLASVAGVEISPIYGHFGIYPVRQTDEISRGAFTLAYRDDNGEVGAYLDGATLLPAMREYGEVRLIQSNHPRDSTGYFDSFHYDPVTGMADSDFSFDFDTMEVINGEDCEQFQDWMSFIAHGRKVIGVGNSDTHSRTSPPGLPRNYLASDIEDASGLTEEAIVTATLSGDLVVSSIAYLELGGDVRPWETYSGDSYEAPLRVLTPPWAQATELVVIRNGVVWERYDIGGGPGEITDFDGPMLLTPEDGKDSWFVFLAQSDERASVVYPGKRIFAFSNPLFIDADGDQVFTSAGYRPMEEGSTTFCR